MKPQAFLAVEQTAEDRFTATLPPADGGRAFGGHLMALAMLAAAGTSDGRLPHSVHAHFLRSGNDTSPVDLAVTRVRDGRGFSTRQVQLSQSGRKLLLATVSLHVAAGDKDWQAEPSRTTVPLRSEAVPSSLGQLVILERFEIRTVHEWVRGQPASAHPYWIRHRDPLGDDPLLHRAVLLMLSDLAMPSVAAGPGLSRREQLAAVSLDHATWIHRQPQLDGWTYLDAQPRTVSGHLGLAHGSLSDADGRLLATSVQEAVLQTG